MASTTRRHALAAAFRVLGAAVVIFSAVAASRPAGAKTSLLSDAPVRDRPMATLTGLDGTRHALHGSEGHVTIVHFFATWCEPCRPEMISLGALQESHGARGLKIVAVSVGETGGTVRRFFADDPPPFAVALDRDRAFAKSWDVGTLPTTVIFDRAMRARLISEGVIDWQNEEVAKCVHELLAEAPPPAGKN